MVLHLPPGMVGLLNALHWGSQDLEHEYQQFLTVWEATGSWYEFNSAYALHAEDQNDLENFAVVFEEIAQMLERELTLETLVPPLYSSVHLMNEVNKRRQSPHFSPLAAVNEMLLAGAAVCSGMGDPRAIKARLPMVQEMMSNTRGLFYEQQPQLPQEIQGELEKGFTLVETALRGLSESLEDKDALADHLSDLKAGAELVHFLVEWDEKQHQQLLDQFDRFNIPVVGAELEMGLESARQADRKQWRRAVRYTREEVLPRLDEFWEMVAPGLLVPPELRLELTDQAYDAIQALKEAVEELVDPDLDEEEALDGLEQALEITSDAFTEIELNALRGEHLQGTPEGRYYECIRGILAGTVPDAALVELLGTSPSPAEVREPLEAYLQGGPEECLFEAVAALLESESASPEEVTAPQDWGCGFCGQRNPLEARQCGRCRATPPSSKGWQA